MTNEAEIRQQIEKMVAAVRAADLARVMSFYARDVVTFDIVPPLQKIGADAKRKNWMGVFATYRRPLGYEIHDLNISARDDVALARSLNRVSGVLTNGTPIDQWLRWTACFWKMDGIWLIMHNHASVPTHLATRRPH